VLEGYFSNYNEEHKSRTEYKDITNYYATRLPKVSSAFFHPVQKTIYQELSPEELYNKLNEDMPKLEKFIHDMEYRNKLLESEEMSLEHFQLVDLCQLEKMVKQKLGIPENASIRFENIRCSKNCGHLHQYFYAYFWDSKLRKLKKKYVGKSLPKPVKFKISIETS
jgi:hypothetical protein